MLLQAYSTAQPVQFMFPGIPGLVPNGTFPSTAAIATSVPGAIKMEFPQNGYVHVVWCFWYSVLCGMCIGSMYLCHAVKYGHGEM